MLDLIAKNQCSEKDTQNGAADSEKLREKGGNPPTFVTSLFCGDQNDKTILNEKQFFACRGLSSYATGKERMKHLIYQCN